MLYYTLYVTRSVRMEPELEEQLARAAEAEGLSASDFIREAVRERSERVLGRTLRDELADVIGAIETGLAGDAGQTARHGGEQRRIAERTGAAFTELLLRRQAARSAPAEVSSRRKTR